MTLLPWLKPLRCLVGLHRFDCDDECCVDEKVGVRLCHRCYRWYPLPDGGGA